MMDLEAIKKGKIKYLRGADLRRADLWGADLWRADLRRADLRRADLRRADLRRANLRKADLHGATLIRADLRGADLRGANFQEADLGEAYLKGADLRGADLQWVNMREADFSEAKLLTTLDWLAANLEKTPDGWVVYKRIGLTHFSPPPYWTIKPGAVLNENCDSNRVLPCSYGINFGTQKWCKENYEEAQLWKCLIRWEWGPGVCVPFNTIGKARCERLELVQTVD